MGEVLVLNADVQPYRWNPLSVVSWKWGIKSYYLGKIDVLEWYAHECRSPSTRIKIPSVVILQEYHRARLRVNFTKRNIFIRDLHRCQYCGKNLPNKELNMDHVIPRDRGGGTSWENVVISCIRCNSKKSNRLPKEAGMRLLKEPKRPPRRPFMTSLYGKSVDKSWEYFLQSKEK